MIRDLVLVIPALSVILGLASSIFLVVNYFKCAQQCLLFGRIYEVSRVQVSGPRIWCLLCVFIGFMTSLTAVLIILEKCGHLRRIRFGEVQRTMLAGSCTMMMFMDASIISYGFYTWCRSLKYYSCNSDHIYVMDWKMFKPRYNECERAWIHLTYSTVLAWCSFATWCFLTIIQGIRFALKS